MLRLKDTCRLEKALNGNTFSRGWKVKEMLIDEISKELEELSSPEEKNKRTHWELQYQEKPRMHGTPTESVRKISARFFSKVKMKSKEEVFQLCEELLSSGYIEERTVAFDWAFRLRKSYVEFDFYILESWLKKYVHSWGACDDLCTHALGAFIFQFPKFISNVKEWANSANRWTRRASAVTLIYSIRRGKHLEHVFEIADSLLKDKDVMVQKGYGWMLKEATRHYPQEVFKYVMIRRKEMPRTSLRYAIEKLSPALRKEAMKKEI